MTGAGGDGRPLVGASMLSIMLGPLIITIVVVILIPVGFLMSTSIAAGVIGFLLKDDAERRHAGSELVDANT